MEVKVYLVPIGEFTGDRVIGRAIVVHQVVERLVGENDAEAEGVVGAVTFVHSDVVAGKALLHQEREIEPPGTATDDDDLHATVSFILSARDRSRRPTRS